MVRRPIRCRGWIAKFAIGNEEAERLGVDRVWAVGHCEGGALLLQCCTCNSLRLIRCRRWISK